MSSSPSSIFNLPNEILIYIFSQQNEKHLIEVVARVCRKWNEIVHLDSMWSTAFSWKWGSFPLIPSFFRPIKEKGERKTVFWRREYLYRQQIELIWKYGALQAVSFDTSLGGSVVNHLDFAIDHYNHIPHFRKRRALSPTASNTDIPRLLVGSIESGSIVTCNSKTGKISRSILKICKKEEEEFDINDTVSCIISANVGINMSWILGSKFDGSIMACFQSEDSNQGVLNSVKLWFPKVHSHSAHIIFPMHEVSSLKEISEKLYHFVDSDSARHDLLHSLHRSNHILFLSASIDGKVALYSTLLSSKCLVEFVGNQESITCIDFFEDTCIAGTSAGKLLFWKIPKEQLLSNFQKGVFETVHIGPCNEIQAFPKKSVPLVQLRKDILSGIIIGQFDNGEIFQISFPDILKPPQFVNHNDKATLTAVEYQPSTNIGSPSLLATGYQSGKVILWAVYPNQSFQNISTVHDQKNAISCIFVSSTLLVSGSDDGSIYIYDTVSFKNLRGLNNKYRNQNILQDRFRVSHIVNYGSILCITQSQSVTSWYLRQKVEKPARKSINTKVPISLSKALQSPSNSHSRQDVEYDIVETLQSVDRKRKSLMFEKSLVTSANGNLETHNMSEQELLEYAKVLSVHGSGSVQVPDYGDLSEAEAIELALALSLSETNS